MDNQNNEPIESTPTEPIETSSFNPPIEQQQPTQPIEQPTPMQPVEPQQPVYQQPVMQQQPQMAPPVASVATAPAAADPGKTLAIVGLVMSFIFLAPIGLILSIIGFKKSKKAGFKNTIGIVGIVLNAVALISGFVIIALMMLTMSSYSVIANKAEASNSMANASAVKSFAEVYYAENGEYPDQISDFKENVGGQISLPSNIIVTSNKNSMKDSYAIYYQFEGDFSDSTGGKVGYYDTEGLKFMYTGYADENSNFSNLR